LGKALGTGNWRIAEGDSKRGGRDATARRLYRLTCDLLPLGGTAMSFAHTWKQRWMLYSSSDLNNPCTFLHNPRTLNRIELPDFPHPLPTGFQCALSDKPTSTAGCIVVILCPYITRKQALGPPQKYWYGDESVLLGWMEFMNEP